VCVLLYYESRLTKIDNINHTIILTDHFLLVLTFDFGIVLRGFHCIANYFSTIEHDESIVTIKKCPVFNLGYVNSKLPITLSLKCIVASNVADNLKTGTMLSDFLASASKFSQQICEKVVEHRHINSKKHILCLVKNVANVKILSDITVLI
jgi:hypothetical protein